MYSYLSDNNRLFISVKSFSELNNSIEETDVKLSSNNVHLTPQISQDNSTSLILSLSNLMAQLWWLMLN